jgi:hypothetical protein
MKPKIKKFLTLPISAKPRPPKPWAAGRRFGEGKVFEIWNS